MKISESAKYSYAILGAARSGIAIAKLLKDNGANVFVSDSSPKDKLQYFDVIQKRFLIMTY